jgi:hypothetical protein
VRLGPEQVGTDLDDLMQRYALRIIGREVVASGPASWGGTRAGPSGTSTYDPAAYWQKVRYTVHRELACERCAFRWGYAFEVDQTSRTHQDGSSSDSALLTAIRAQIRRRIKCPRCRHVQAEPRNSLRRRDLQQNLVGCLSIALPLPLVGVLVWLGGQVLGGVGAVLGLILGLLLAVGVIAGSAWYLLWAESD